MGEKLHTNREELRVDYTLETSGEHRKFSWGGISFSGIWWSFVFSVGCLWCHNL